MTGSNGRNGKSLVAQDPKTGRFLPGNSGGPGNPYTRQVSELRKAFAASCSPEEIMSVKAVLLELALAGNVPAIKEYLDRAMGKVPDVVEIEEASNVSRALTFGMDGEFLEAFKRSGTLTITTTNPEGR